MVPRHFPLAVPSIALVAALCLSVATPLSAQSPEPVSNWELNLHAATMRPDLFDESSGALQFGGRLFRNFGSGVSIGANVDWARTSDVTVAPLDGLSASLLLYSAELGYDVRVSPRAVFHLGVGVGQAKLDLDRALAGAAESSTGLLVPAGGGVKIHNRAVAPSWAIRFDVRDNVILLETLSPDGGTETEPRHNIEGSIGLSFLFGGGGGGAEPIAADVDRDGVPERPAPDSDRDGVPDERDECFNSSDVPVDARGCPQQPDAQEEPEAPPVEEEGAPDADGDGVSDFADACPATPEGVEVGSDGCETEPEFEPEPEFVPEPEQPAAGEPAEGGPADSDGDGVLDEADACPGTPEGIPVDAQGCLARIAPRPEPGEEEEEPGERRAFPVPIVPPADRGEPPAAGACREETDTERGIEFDGRSFRPVGFPQPVDRTYLVQIGTFEGIPLFVSDTAQPPYGDFWVPICGQAGIFDLYIEAGP